MTTEEHFAQYPKPTLEAAQQYIGCSILRRFEEGEFKGQIIRVDPFLDDDDVNGPFFLVRYIDEDEEHLTWEDIEPCLLPPAGQPVNSSEPEQLSSFQLGVQLQPQQADTQGQHLVHLPAANAAEVIFNCDDDNPHSANQQGQAAEHTHPRATARNNLRSCSLTDVEVIEIDDCLDYPPPPKKPRLGCVEGFTAFCDGGDDVVCKHEEQTSNDEHPVTNTCLIQRTSAHGPAGDDTVGGNIFTHDNASLPSDACNGVVCEDGAAVVIEVHAGMLHAGTAHAAMLGAHGDTGGSGVSTGLKVGDGLPEEGVVSEDGVFGDCEFERGASEVDEEDYVEIEEGANMEGGVYGVHEGEAEPIQADDVGVEEGAAVEGVDANYDEAAPIQADDREHGVGVEGDAAAEGVDAIYDELAPLQADERGHDIELEEGADIEGVNAIYDEPAPLQADGELVVKPEEDAAAEVVDAMNDAEAAPIQANAGELDIKPEDGAAAEGVDAINAAEAAPIPANAVELGMKSEEDAAAEGVDAINEAEAAPIPANAGELDFKSEEDAAAEGVDVIINDTEAAPIQANAGELDTKSEEDAAAEGVDAIINDAEAAPIPATAGELDTKSEEDAAAEGVDAMNDAEAAPIQANAGELDTKPKVEGATQHGTYGTIHPPGSLAPPPQQTVAIKREEQAAAHGGGGPHANHADPGPSQPIEVIEVIDLLDDDDDHPHPQPQPQRQPQTKQPSIIEILDDDDGPEVDSLQPPRKRPRMSIQDFLQATPEIPRIPSRSDPAVGPSSPPSSMPTRPGNGAAPAPAPFQEKLVSPATTGRIWRSWNPIDAGNDAACPPSPVYAGGVQSAEEDRGADGAAGPSCRTAAQTNVSQSTPLTLRPDPQPSSRASPVLSQPSSCRHEGRVGHLYEICVQNFMCLEHFRMKFGPNVNFISGTNGSGKSAVLQGLQCCLGVTARNTGRAVNMGEFIKTGAIAGRVIVTIWNTGEDAYKPELFGNKITVKRTIRRNGSEFKLYGSAGRDIKASGRVALEELLDHLCVNAANPLTVLTQDSSRDFLAGHASDRRKFELFMEGTALQHTEDITTAIQQFLATAVSKANNLNDHAIKLKTKYDDLKMKLDTLQKLDQEREMRDHLEKALPWSLVMELRQDIKRVKDLIDSRYPADIEQAKRRVKATQRELGICERNHDNEKQRLMDINSTLQQLLERRQTMRESERSAVQIVRSSKKERDEATQHLAELEKERKDLQAILDSADNAASAEQQQLLTGLSQKVDVVKNDLIRSQQALEGWRRQLEQVSEGMEDLRERKRNSVRELALVAAEASQLEQEHLQLTSGATHSIFWFGGPRAQRVQRLIEERLTQFHRPPIGPVGMLLRLTEDERWASLVELAIGRLFDGYICHDAHDAGIMRQIIKAADHTRATIYTLDFDIPQHRVPADKQPPPGYLTVLRVVTCTDPAVQAVVMNMLIDQAGAEATMLVETSEMARDMLYNGMNGYCPARAYERRGVQGAVWAKHSYGVSCNPCKPPLLARLATDNSQQVACVREQLQQTQAKLQGLQQEVSTLDQEMSRLMQQQAHIHHQQNQAVADLHKSKLQMFNLERESQQVQQRIESDNSEGNHELIGRLATLSPAIAAAQVILDTCQAKVAETEQQLLELQEPNHTSGDCVSDLEEQVIEVQTALHTLSTQRQTLMEELEARRRDVVACETKLKEAQANLQECQQLEPERTAEANEACNEAEGSASLRAVEQRITSRVEKMMQRQARALNQAGEQMQQAVRKRVESRMNFTELMKLLTKLNACIKAVEDSAGGHAVDLKGELDVVTAKFDKACAKMNRVKAAHDKLSKGLSNLRRKCEDMKREMAHNVKLKFRGYMRRKGHSGELTVKWEEERIELEVRMNVQQYPGAKKVTDLKQLSGGERSFTTVCFILAMAEYTDTPFRCMDEYDIFMDAVNRRISTEVLLEFALESSHLQYVFLTPQDIRAVQHAKERLEHKRNQKLPDGFMNVVRMRAARPRAAQPAKNP